MYDRPNTLHVSRSGVALAVKTFVQILGFRFFFVRLSSLQEHYRALAQKEKLDRESKRFVGRKLSYMQLSDKYGLTAAVARRRAGLPPIGGSPFGSPAHGGGGGQDGGARQAEPAAAEAK